MIKIKPTHTEPIGTSEFEQLFNDHYSRLCAYAFHFIKEEDAAEEIVQEVFFKLWTKRKRISIESSLHSYLYRSVRNASLNLIKHINIREEYKKQNQFQIEQTEMQENIHAEVSELEQKIRNSIDLLPEQRRKIFILSRYEGLKYKEIAEKMNISVKTVENQMGKALQFLRTELAEYLPLILIFFQEFLSGK